MSDKLIAAIFTGTATVMVGEPAPFYVGWSTVRGEDVVRGIGESSIVRVRSIDVEVLGSATVEIGLTTLAPQVDGRASVDVQISRLRARAALSIGQASVDVELVRIRSITSSIQGYATVTLPFVLPTSPLYVPQGGPPYAYGLDHPPGPLVQPPIEPPFPALKKTRPPYPKQKRAGVRARPAKPRREYVEVLVEPELYLAYDRETDEEELIILGVL